MAIPTKPKTDNDDGAAVEAPPAADDDATNGERDEEEGAAEDSDSVDDGLPQKIVTGTLYERICQPIILVVSAGLNIPPFILSMLSIKPADSTCDYYFIFLIVNGICCLVNIGAVIYSIVKLRQKMLEDYVSHEAHIELQLERQIERESRRRSQQLYDQKQESQHVPGGGGGGGVEDAASHENGESSKTSTNNGDKSSSADNSGLPATTETADATATSTTQSRTTSTNGTVEQVMMILGEEGEKQEDITFSSSSGRLRRPSHSHPRPEYHRRLSGFQGRVRSRRTQSSNRLRHLICYNAQISTYAIVFIFWVFWLSSGAQLESRQYDGSTDQTKLENCQDYHRDYVTTSVTLG
eukprot:CAMPEP_0113501672 /NCGR_PEP_ID=MMETSP0014_2-20120614/33092_1 /TAXON_ID=2857 /ORGANISM="Nitzschia sp." /LENGTH=352 /DNA_ID=CAMNT_0000396301 /DNA_START=99 /DNA_END=1154 /DNA_ORIENTATION=+ /assembly_acc=CAM_ASM_000159